MSNIPLMASNLLALQQLQPRAEYRDETGNLISVYSWCALEARKLAAACESSKRPTGIVGRPRVDRAERLRGVLREHPMGIDSALALARVPGNKTANKKALESMLAAGEVCFIRVPGEPSKIGLANPSVK